MAAGRSFLLNPVKVLARRARPAPAARTAGASEMLTAQPGERHFTHQLVTGSTLRTNWLSQN
jgi:hypothetical protein